jgi:hypothetical protein
VRILTTAPPVLSTRSAKSGGPATVVGEAADAAPAMAGRKKTPAALSSIASNVLRMEKIVFMESILF